MPWSKPRVIVAATVALLLLLFGAAAMLTQRAVLPTEERVVVIRPVAAIGDGTVAADWQSKFNAVYGLAPGEVLRRVPPPFIEERQHFWDAQQHRQGANRWLLHQQERFTMVWDGQAARWTSLSMAETTVGSVLQTCVQLAGWEMDRSSLPVGLPLPGDWVFRQGATPEEKLGALAQIVSARIGRTIHFEKVVALREAIVVRGNYHFVPLVGSADDGAIEIIGEPPTEQHPPKKSSSTIGALLKKVENYTNVRVFDETGTGGTAITVRDHGGVDNAQILLTNLAKQTSLTFARERRPVGAWCMVDSSGHATTIDPPDFVKAYAPSKAEAVRCITPPYGPERAAFLDIVAPGGTEPLKPTNRLVLTWDDQSFQLHTAADRLTLSNVLHDCLHVDWCEFDKSVPMDGELGDGDIVVHRASPVGDQLQGIAKVLSRQSGRAVHFERRPMPCEVIVAIGAPTPATGSAVPVLATDDGSPKPRSPVLHTDSHAFFKVNLPAMLRRRVVDETTGPNIQITWQAAFTGPVRTDALLEQLTQQTGLQFRKEERDQDLWTLVAGPAVPAAAERISAP